MTQFLAEKLKGFEESTLHALEPEFSRLRMTAEQDLADISAKLSEDTRRMKSDMKTLYASKLSSEEKNLREDQRMLARVRLDEAVLEAEQLERVHKRKLVVMTEELTKSLDIFRNNLSQKVSVDFVMNSITARYNWVLLKGNAGAGRKCQ